MQIYAEMRGMYDAKMASCIVYAHTKLETNSIKIKVIIGNFLSPSIGQLSLLTIQSERDGILN